jgi:hypothetical protein
MVYCDVHCGWSSSLQSWGKIYDDNEMAVWSVWKDTVSSQTRDCNRRSSKCTTPVTMSKNSPVRPSHWRVKFKLPRCGCVHQPLLGEPYSYCAILLLPLWSWPLIETHSNTVETKNYTSIICHTNIPKYHNTIMHAVLANHALLNLVMYDMFQRLDSSSYSKAGWCDTCTAYFCLMFCVVPTLNWNVFFNNISEWY